MKTKIIAIIAATSLLLVGAAVAEIIRNLAALTGAGVDSANDRLIINDDSANTDKSITIDEARIGFGLGTAASPTFAGLQLGATGVAISQDSDGALTMLGSSAGADESLTWNFDDTTDEVDVTSTTGAVIDFSGLGLKMGPTTDANGVQIHHMISAVGAGTAYTMTNAYATVDMGTTDPSIAINATGTYMVWANVQVSFAGATYAALDSCTFRIQEQTGAATVTDSERGTFLPVMTTTTVLGPSVTLGPVEHIAADTDDVLVVQGDLVTAPSAGSVTVTKCTIFAVRIK
jgi:hypothetical protein